MPTIVIIHAGMSEESSTANLASRFRSALEDASAAPASRIEVRTIALRPLAHAITDHALTGFPSDRLAEAQKTVMSADGIVALTPTYQASYSGLFKSFFDVLDPDALRGKPVALGATGGTPRHSLVTEVAMRPLFTYQHADPVPTAVYAATEDWGAHAHDSDPSGGDGLSRRIRRASQELLSRLPGRGPTRAAGEQTTRTATLDAHTKAPTEADTWPGFVEFEELMGGIE